ncbi:hypothetical protein MRB53_040969 [Persea americana]|nr:hypothetical protein MRB53_040969 [Persea americana]
MLNDTESEQVSIFSTRSHLHCLKHLQNSGCDYRLSSAGIDTVNGLLAVPEGPGSRAFDIFYYILSASTTPAERRALSLQDASHYDLLRRGGSCEPPPYVDTADDCAAGEHSQDMLRAIRISGRRRRDVLSRVRDCRIATRLDPVFLIRECNPEDRTLLIEVLYEAIVNFVLENANAAISAALSAQQDVHDGISRSTSPAIMTPRSGDDDDTKNITIVDVPDPGLGRALALRNVFDDSEGSMNSEMQEDGLVLPHVSNLVIEELRSAVSSQAQLTSQVMEAGARFELREDRIETLVEKARHRTEDGSVLDHLVFHRLGRDARQFNIDVTMTSDRIWFQLCLHPTDITCGEIKSRDSWSAVAVSQQLRSWRLSEWAQRRSKGLEYTADFEIDEFATHYAPLGCLAGEDGVRSFTWQRGWQADDAVIGHSRVWIREHAWWNLSRRWTLWLFIPAQSAKSHHMML